MEGFVKDIEDIAVKNNEFRRVLYGGWHPVAFTKFAAQFNGAQDTSGQNAWSGPGIRFAYVPYQ